MATDEKHGNFPHSRSACSMSVGGVDAQGDPCTATIFWSIARRHMLYSASSPVPVTKYSNLHNGMQSLSLGSIKILTQTTKSELSSCIQKKVWSCFCCDVAPPTNRTITWKASITGFLLMALATFYSCRFLVVHISPTRTGELNSRHPQSPMRVEGIHTSWCCLVPRRDRLWQCSHHLSAMQTSTQCLTPWLRWIRAMYAVLGCPPPTTRMPRFGFWRSPRVLWVSITTKVPRLLRRAELSTTATSYGQKWINAVTLKSEL
jgi:hypothetical protein